MNNEFLEYINLDIVEMFLIHKGYVLDEQHKIKTRKFSSIPVEYRYFLEPYSYLSFNDFRLLKVVLDENFNKLSEEFILDEEYVSYILSRLNPNRQKVYIKDALDYTNKQIKLNENTSGL